MKDYINNQHRYYTLDFYLKKRFASKVFKVALNGNFSCPNRDGTISDKGCLFCSPEGSGDFGGNRFESLKEQFDKVSSVIHHKWPNAKYIAYFQANTNTYGPLKKLKNLFEEAIKLSPDIVALSIATRPDCLSEDILNYLAELNKKIPLWIELGLQTINEDTAKYINRGYKLEVFTQAVMNLRERDIEVIIHIINGLPGENKETMLKTIRFLNSLDIQGIKIHSLFVLKNTPLGDIYRQHPFKMLSQTDYVDIVCDQLAILRDDIVVHRLNGDAPKELLIAPEWGMKKFVIMNEIDKEMKKREYTQGINYK